MASIPPSPRTPTTPRTPGFNTKSPTIKRILQEARELSQCKDPSLAAAPLETNLFEWHFTIRGPPATPYALGLYHGRIVLPPTYPLRPPAFRFLTPSGRFEVNREICLSISGHHEESWQPAWGVRTALCAIRAFMAGEAQGQLGGLDMAPAARAELADASRAWRCPSCGGRTNEDIMAENAAEAGDEAAQEAEIPPELQLTYKNDLDSPKPKTPARTAFGSEGRSLASPGLKPDVGARAGARQAPSSPLSQAFRAGGSTVSAAPSPRSPTSPRVGPAPARRRSPQQDSIPLWAIDAAIIAVVVGLVIMLLRKLVVF